MSTWTQNVPEYLACLFIILKLREKVSGKASVLISASLAAGPERVPVYLTMCLLSLQDWGKEENEVPTYLYFGGAASTYSYKLSGS